MYFKKKVKTHLDLYKFTDILNKYKKKIELIRCSYKTLAIEMPIKDAKIGYLYSDDARLKLFDGQTTSIELNRDVVNICYNNLLSDQLTILFEDGDLDSAESFTEELMGLIGL